MGISGVWNIDDVKQAGMAMRDALVGHGWLDGHGYDFADFAGAVNKVVSAMKDAPLSPAAATDAARTFLLSVVQDEGKPLAERMSAAELLLRAGGDKA